MKKVSLVLLFSGGFFVMIAAILRVTYVMVVSQFSFPRVYKNALAQNLSNHRTLEQQQNGAAAAIWSCREDFVATIVGQAPMGM